MNLGIPLKDATGDGWLGSFPHSPAENQQVFGCCFQIDPPNGLCRAPSGHVPGLRLAKPRPGIQLSPSEPMTRRIRPGRTSHANPEGYEAPFKMNQPLAFTMSAAPRGSARTLEQNERDGRLFLSRGLSIGKGPRSPTRNPLLGMRILVVQKV